MTLENEIFEIIFLYFQSLIQYKNNNIFKNVLPI